MNTRYFRSAVFIVILAAAMTFTSCGNLMTDIMNEIAAGSVPTYTLTFEANGGTGTMASITGTEGETVTLPENTFTRTGYEFYGWSASAGGVIHHYSGDDYTFASEDAQLYARWNHANTTGKESFTYSLTNGEVTITEYSGTDTEVIIPAFIDGFPVTAVGDNVFKNRSDLTSVTIPGAVTSIGNYAFYCCSSLASVTIPDSVTSIGDYAFFSCEGIASVTIPDSVTSVGDYAFFSCEGITSLTIPDSLTTIGYMVFRNCVSLTSLTIPDSVTSIGGFAFDHCALLESLIIPDSVITIGEGAFRDCVTLTSVTIPDSVTSVGEDAFSYCAGLTSITIGNSVASIGVFAFSNCTDLTSVTVNAISPPVLGSNVFSDSLLLQHIYVPVGTVGAYQTAWSDYSGYITEQS